MNDFIQSPYFTYIIIPILICLARIVDVSLGTLRILFVSKGFKRIAPILGFFEVLIWLFAIGIVMQNLTNIVNYFAYALGFALGNYIGISIEQKLAVGKVMVQVVTQRNASELITFLKNTNYGVTVIEAKGVIGPVNIIITVINRTKLPTVVAHIKSFNPKAFYLVEDVRFVSDTIFSAKTFWWKPKFTALLGARKAK